MLLDKNEFGEYLRKLRNKRNLTTNQVELYAGVSNSYISLLENGKRGIPSPEILRKLASLYRVSYDELMTKAGYLEDYKAEIKQPELEIPTYDERISGLSKENQNVIEKMLSWLESQERVKKE
jgi:transcriptional regulator with XRE-family HTH domain